MTNLIGQTLGRYKMIGLLGEGGMGAVYKARDLTLKRVVAIKVLHPNFARRSDIRERFLQEAQIAAGLKHPGIVEVYDFGQTKDDILYIVMAFIPGADLDQMLQDMRTLGKWLPLEEAVGLMRLICEAVDYAHRHGVLHRDLKPGNIMLEPEPTEGLPFRPVLTDLGLAKLLEGTPITQQGTLMGTPAYMSPEQARGETADARSDVYSLGVLLYELAVGKLPFPAKTITEAIRYHTQEPPPPPRSINSNIPEELERVILKALAKDPNERYKDAVSLAQELEVVRPAVSDITAPPTLLDGTVVPKAVSLMTQYQQSLIAARVPSDFEAPPDLLTDQGITQIQIRSRDKTTRSVAMKANRVTIGRDAEEDIFLNDPKVSREHARIEFDGSTYRVVDLDSTNGTFLDGIRLLAGVPADLTPDKVLRIGDSWLRLLPSEKTDDRQITGSQPVPSKVEEEWIEIQLENDQLDVEPGGSVSLQVAIKNLGEKVDHFTVTVSGISVTWLPELPSPIQLMPGAAKDINLLIKPPRTSQSKAVRYPLTVKISSQNDPGQVVEIGASLNVASYSQFNTVLQPVKVQAGEPATVVIENQGNLPETFTLNWQDRGNELVFTPPRQQLNIPEGQKSMTEFRAEPRQRRWIGGEKSHPVSVQIQPVRGEPQTLAGEVVSRALIPAWVPPVVLLLLSIICVITFTLIKPLFEPQIDFSLEPESPILANNAVKLTWFTRNAQSVQVLDASGKQIENSTRGSYLFDKGFTEDGELRIIAKNFIGEEVRTIPVLIMTPSPEIITFAISPTKILLGQSVDISWDVENVETVYIDQLGTLRPKGSESYIPLETGIHKFNLTARNKSEEVSKKIELVVEMSPIPRPEITTFTVNPNEIVKGEINSIRFDWETKGADQVSITGVGQVTPADKGFIDWSAPEKDTTYTLIAENRGVKNTADASLVVKDRMCEIVSQTNARLRSGPGKAYVVLKSFPPGTQLIPREYRSAGFPSGEWLYVESKEEGEEGWIMVIDDDGEKLVKCNFDYKNLPKAENPPPTPTSEPIPQIQVKSSDLLTTPGSTNDLQVNCPDDSNVTGGGYSGDYRLIVKSNHQENNGWKLTVENGSDIELNFTAYAICLTNSLGQTYSVNNWGESYRFGLPVVAEVFCPEGSIVTGGGWASDKCRIFSSRPEINNSWSSFFNGALNQTGESYITCLSESNGEVEIFDDDDVLVQPGSSGFSEIVCPNGMLATGGGISGDQRWIPFTSRLNTGQNGWEVYAYNQSDSPGSFRAVVVCIKFP